MKEIKIHGRGSQGAVTAALKVLKRKGRFPADRKVNVFTIAGSVT